jgi:HEAT repeat protein
MTPPELKSLLEALASGDDNRAEEAALALGQLGDALLPDLRALLPSDNIDIRWWATRALGEIGSEPAIALLLEQCDDPDHDVRVCAIYALGAFGERSASAVPTLLRCLADASVYVGRMAADALARIGSAATPGLIDRLKNGSSSVRGRAARALAQIADPTSIPALIAALEDENPIVEYYADSALQKMGVGMVLLKI